MNDAKQKYLTEAKNLDKDSFLKKYKNPFLVQYIESYITQTDKTNFSMPKLEDLIKIETQAQQKHITDIQPIVKTSRNPHTDKITVGRIDTHDIIINSHSISKFHAFFSHDLSVFTFTDVGSTNGSKINGILLKPNEDNFIKDKDIISFATINYTYYNSKTAYEIFRGNI